MNNQVSTYEQFDLIFAQVEQAKQQWEAAVDALPELICVVDDTGHIIRANRAVEDWTEVRVTEIVGQNLHDLIHPGCTQPCYVESFWERVTQEADSFNLVTLQKYDPLLEKHLLIRARRTGKGKWQDRVNMIVILQDETKQRQMEFSLRENAKRFKVLNAISQSILIAQSPNQIASLVLQHLPTLIPHNFACIFSYDSNMDEMKLLGSTGHEGEVIQTSQLRKFPQISSEIRHHFRRFFVVDDATKSAKMQKILAELSLNTMQSVWNVPLVVEKSLIGTIILADEKPNHFKKSQHPVVKEVAKLLTVALRQAWLRKRLESSNENLQNLLRANQEQLQTVSHELRSPIGIFKGYTELLHQGLLGPLTEEQKDALAILDKKGEQMLHMVQSLFTLQKVDSTNLQREDVDPGAFVKEIVDSWQVLTKNKEMRLSAKLESDLPNLYVDRNLLTQVLSNLIDNALKFSQPGDGITVEARANTNGLIFSVADEGEGIPPDKVENVFERYYQLEKGSAQAKLGAGIGLALCHKIVTAHDGRIWVESAGENQGSTFYVSLPNSFSNEALAL